MGGYILIQQSVRWLSNGARVVGSSLKCFPHTDSMEGGRPGVFSYQMWLFFYCLEKDLSCHEVQTMERFVR